jgi:hypothetical protein
VEAALRQAAPPALPEPLRLVVAALRWRARGLRALAPACAEGARFLPALLHASFPAARLDGDAPGVAGLRYRRSWTGLARRFSLPPPSRAWRGPALVQAVVGIPATGGVLDVVLLAARGLPPTDLGRLQERAEAIQALFAARKVPLRVALYDAARLRRDRETACRAAAFGALLGGSVDGEAWDALAAGARPAVDGRLSAALAARAPLPSAAFALTLLSGGPAPGPLDLLEQAIAAGAPARRAGDVEALCVRWASRAPGRTALADALRCARDPSAGAREILESGRALALACAAALRRGRAAVARNGRALWAMALGPGVPRILLPALGARLAEALAAAPVAPARRGRAWEVRLADGALLGRGAYAAQARARALALAGAALAEARGVGEAARAAALAGLAPAGAWTAVARRLAAPADRPVTVLAVEGAPADSSAPPWDLLNRGPARAIGLDGALALQLAPARRVAARRVPTDATLRTALAAAVRGEAEIVAADAEARPLAARLAQALAPVAAGGDHPIAVEAGGAIWIAEPRRMRRWPAARFALRPRRCTPDPAAPDLATPPGRRGAGAAMVHCRIVTSDDGVALLFADGGGWQLRVPVAADEVEARLEECRAVLRGCAEPAVLALAMADFAAAARPPSRARRVEVAVRGELPAVAVEIGAERFGGPGALGWRAAAEAVLAASAASHDARLSVRDVRVTVGGAPAGAMASLWAASVARRRLHTSLRLAVSAYRRAAAFR